MCILFFVIGDADHPTVVCSNRDEFYVRPTRRGQLLADCYAPLDLEGGGTWLTFDRLRDSTGMRFAVVLNYHIWRDDASLLAKEMLFGGLRSRGKLVSGFIEGSQSAAEYAHTIFQTRDLYRAFNLVISDGSGAYYVSSCPQQTEPRALAAGTLHGISNGYMDARWEKVSRGLGLLTGPLAQLSSSEDLQAHLLRLLAVMRDTTALADPSFGAEHPALMRLAAICSLPTVISKPARLGSLEDLLGTFSLPAQGDGSCSRTLFGTRTTTVLLHQSSGYLAKHTVTGTNISSEPCFAILEDDIDHTLQGSVQIVSSAT